ncbi:MAG TPA: efflux RND transporter periplasmic adaptor subunit, partial [Planctomycetota bacterium]|nr:efflux RND transporter periplasmic adaptor subunit [Planctomycetota bacterium]
MGLLLFGLAGAGGYWAGRQGFGEAPRASSSPSGAAHTPADAPSVATKAPAAARAAIPVVAATSRKGDLNLYLTGLGAVTPLTTVTLKSRVDGEIVKINFTEGQLVHEGDVLIEIDHRPFEVLLHQNEAQLAKDQALLKNAKADLKRYNDAKNAVSEQVLATQEALVSQYEAATRADQAQVDNAKLQLTYSNITAPVTGRIGLRMVDLGNQVHASDTTGLAVITQTQPMSVIFNLPEESLRPILPKIRASEKLPVDAYDRDLKTVLATGTVLALDNQVDPSTGTVRVRAVFPNEKEALLPNQFVNARLLAVTRKDVVIVPTAAIQRGQTTLVYIIKPEPAGASPKASGNAADAGKTPPPASEGGAGKASPPALEGRIETRTVRPGPSEGEETIIESGLEPGELVVTEGVDKLVPKSRVVVLRWSDAPAGAKKP